MNTCKACLVFLVIVLLGADVAAANPFTAIWNTLPWANRQEPPAVVNCVLQDRDFRRGPVADDDEWNLPCVLEGELTAAQLANVKHPSRFLNTRKAHAAPPTPAVWVNADGSVSKLNPVYLLSRQRADALAGRLARLGCRGMVVEAVVSNPFSHVEWRGEARRVYYWQAENETVALGLVNDAYASTTTAAADALALADLGGCKDQ